MPPQDLRAKHSMAIHCCTFSLTDEPLDEPPIRLQEECQKAGLPAGAFLTLQHGEQLRVRGGQALNEPKTLPLAQYQAPAQ